jgi:hypothetical protein
MMAFFDIVKASYRENPIAATLCIVGLSMPFAFRPMFTKHALWGRIRRLEQITAGLNAESCGWRWALSPS